MTARPGLRAALDLLDAWCEARVAQFALPGLSIALVHDQEVIWARGYGGADPATRYRIASMTKLFTATVAMRLRDQGALRLDDPVAHHLSWFRDAGAARPVTIRHLLTHSSGFAREAPFPYWSDFAFPTAEQLRDSFGEAVRIHPPERRWKYSNLGAALLGEVAAAASGSSWADQVCRAILDPLGMTRTMVATPTDETPGMAPGFGRIIPGQGRARRPHSDLAGLSAAGGITSSVLDLCQFLKLQFRDGPAGGEQVLSGETLREMHRAHWLDPDWQGGWGLGFRISREGGRSVVGHSGLIAGFSSEVRFLPDERLGVVVLTNCEDGLPAVFAQRALQWVSPALALPPPAAAIDPDWSRYVGRYRDAWTDLQVLVDGQGNFVVPPHWLDPSAGMVRLRPVGRHSFCMEAGGFDYADEVLTFDAQAEGPATAVRIGRNPLHRVEGW